MAAHRGTVLPDLGVPRGAEAEAGLPNPEKQQLVEQTPPGDMLSQSLLWAPCSICLGPSKESKENVSEFFTGV